MSPMARCAQGCAAAPLQFARGLLKHFGMATAIRGDAAAQRKIVASLEPGCAALAGWLGALRRVGPQPAGSFAKHSPFEEVRGQRAPPNPAAPRPGPACEQDLADRKAGDEDEELKWGRQRGAAGVAAPTRPRPFPLDCHRQSKAKVARRP